jgi:hypothetical protein
MPAIFSGLKVSITLAVVGAVVGEFVGSNSGIGYVMQRSIGTFDLPTMFARLVILALLGVVLFWVVDRIERLRDPLACQPARRHHFCFISPTIKRPIQGPAPNTNGRKTMIRTIAAISAALIWTALSVLPASAADKVVLMLNWYVYGEHAPFYYGKAKGIYAAEGIDLEIQEGRGSAATTQAVAAKTANFGYVDVPTMMRAAVKGAPITATGVLLQTSPMSAMGFVEKNIKKPEDIKGKTVAITPADSMTQIWPLFLKKTGLKESDFQTVAATARPS